MVVEYRNVGLLTVRAAKNILERGIALFDAFGRGARGMGHGASSGSAACVGDGSRAAAQRQARSKRVASSRQEATEVKVHEPNLNLPLAKARGSRLVFVKHLSHQGRRSRSPRHSVRRGCHRFL